MSFVHLHVHSHFSLLDGLGNPKDLVKLAKDQGSPAIAITDHGYLYGAIEFYKAAEEIGIKPIIGCEVYVAPASRFDRTPGSENKPFHLTLLASNFEGYKNLMYLVSMASLEGFYYKPRIDFELLQRHHKGLIALSGCLAGELANAVAEQNEKKQFEVIEKYQSTFGKENYYLEIQNHPLIPEQQILTQRLVEIHQKTGIPLVATQDSHYLREDDHFTHDILLCIQTQTNIHETNRMKFQGDFSLASPEMMRNIFKEFPDACDNTLAIAEKCNIKIPFGQNLIPHFKTPQSEKASEYLRYLCEKGLEELYRPDERAKAEKQLDYELSIVHKMGFDDYFLIVHDFVKFAKDNQIAVGPGRGSAAGSIIAYTLKITELDPLKHGLIFERFLNPERISMPDIDIDFADHRRGEVIEYVSKKYGKQNVAQIITFGTMAAKAAVRDVGRGLGYPYSEVDRIAKLVPQPVLGKHAPLKVSVENNPELKKAYQEEPRTKELLDNAIKLEGTVRHAGTHASAVVMSQEPLVNYTPLQKGVDGGDDIITQYSMKPLEDIGLLKMDFLGLKNLTIIEHTLNLIEKVKKVKIDLTAIPIDDQKTFELLQKGDTTGVFQLESPGMRRYIKELKPTQFEDIVAMISLYRPGPMPWIPTYIKGKHNPDQVKYLDPSFEEILKETYGIAIYQEQILLIARKFAGFSLGEADLLRKAVGKKDPKLLSQQKEKFVEGAIKCEHSKQFAIEVFEKVIEPFAGYGFNKAHAACYGMISYRTAYLKAHYPIEFMAALLTSDQGNLEKIASAIGECEEMGINVLPPSINESFSSFTVVDDKTIRFGLSAIKGVGEGAVEEVLKARKRIGKFKSLTDFTLHVPSKLINKKTIESLAYSGAFDELGNRRQIAENYDILAKYAKSQEQAKSKNEAQGDLFGGMEEETSQQGVEDFKLRPVEPLNMMEKLKLEKELLGLYVSAHPLRGLKGYLSKKVNLIKNLNGKNSLQKIKIGGILTKLKKVMTKAGAYMAYAEIEDPTGKIEVVIFPKYFEQFQHLLREDQVMFMEGKVETRRDALQFSCQSVTAVALDVMINNAKNSGLYNEKEKLDTIRKDPSVLSKDTQNGDEKNNIFILKIPKHFNTSRLKEIQALLPKYPGPKKVEIHLENGNQLQKISTAFSIEDTSDFLLELKKLLG